MKHDSQQKRRKKKRPSSGDGAATSGVNTKELDEEKRHIESLMDAFCSVSMEEATSAYREAAGDLNKAAELLSDLVENGDDPSTSSGQETGSTSEYGAGSSSSCCGDDVARESLFMGGRSKQIRVIAATGMVSSVIAKDYLKAKKEFPSFVERSKELSGKKAGDREKAEQFLTSMLGDDCELSMAVVRDVLCQCGYDVDMVSRLSSSLHGAVLALNVLLDMSSSSSTNDDSLSGRSSRIGFSDSLADTSFDTDTSESEPSFWGGFSPRDYSKALMSDPFTTRQGSCEPFHPQKMLESLFNIPQSTKHEPKTMSWRNVAKKMQSLGIDASSSSGEGSHPENFALDSSIKQPINAYITWLKAAEAYSKGGRAHAAYLSDKGRAASKLAQRADERASQDIFVARNKGIENMITIDLHGQHVKQAMRLLKMHLLLGAYVPSIQTLRVITGCGSHGFGKSKVKQSVTKLLEREGVGYCEENRGTLLIKLEGCSREFSFIDTESDSDLS
ncbi:hypothetical protein YC2023_027453 [Brassica napus]